MTANEWEKIFDGLLHQATEEGVFSEEEEDAWAENLSQNVMRGVRQVSNRVKSQVQGPSTLDDLIPEDELGMSPSYSNNLENSFKSHLTALQRQVADELAQKMKAKTFMGISQNSPPVILKLDEYGAGNYPSLPRNPASTVVAVPIPDEYDFDTVTEAKKLLYKTTEERWAEFNKMEAELAKQEHPPLGR